MHLCMTTYNSDKSRACFGCNKSL